MFACGVLPPLTPSPVICTRATMWALPEISASLYVAQHSNDNIDDVVKRTGVVFEALKAYLKRAPSLKGAALVKLSQLKLQSKLWPGFHNLTAMITKLESYEISSDDWFDNIIKIYKKGKSISTDDIDWQLNVHEVWAYPTVAKVFYDALSHSIVVPLSIMLVPYFDVKTPPYLQYASVGVALGKEILRSITKSFEDKAMRCVPNSVNVFSNYSNSRMDILIHSGGMQISYHSMLSLSPLKTMARLPGLNLTPTQVFFVVAAQELCAESDYTGINTELEDFGNM